MDLRPPEYKNINDLMMGSIDPTYQVLIRTCIELCKGMRALHNKGLCYRDISFGNAFFDSLTGDILICDNDNVTQNNSANGSILGTPDFMAPEIVRREKEPSNHTDLHSLAVLLFYMLFMGHPLSGRTILSIRCWDRAAREQLYGKEPLFIFHPTNRKNEAVDLAHDPTGEAGGFAIKYWNKYPERFKSKVSKAFTDGIVNPNGRVTELEWIAELVHLHDSIVKCSCGKVNFLTAIPGQKCGYCDKLLPNRPTLKIGSTSVVLDRTTKIYQHHLGKKYEFTQPTGEVVQNPQNPQIWGLRNKTNTNWYATTSSGQQVEILPNRSIPIVKGTKVKFGNNIDGIFE